MLALSGLRLELAGKTVIADATAALPRGRAPLLVGANGAGKTTLLRGIAGRLETAGGSVEDGAGPVDVRSAAWRRRRVLVEASGGYLEDFSATEQLRLRASLLALGDEEGERRTAALEAAFGFAQFRDLRASELSTGF